MKLLCCCFVMLLFLSSNDLGSNQICAKVSVCGRHVNFNGGNWPCARIQRDDVTSLQVEHPACVQGTAVSYCSLYWRLSHGNDFVVHTNINSSIVVVVNLSVNVVPSRARHSQLSVSVRHTACKMAVRGVKLPVFDHWKASKKQLRIALTSPLL